MLAYFVLRAVQLEPHIQVSGCVKIQFSKTCPRPLRRRKVTAGYPKLVKGNPGIIIGIGQMRHPGEAESSGMQIPQDLIRGHIRGHQGEARMGGP